MKNRLFILLVLICISCNKEVKIEDSSYLKNHEEIKNYLSQYKPYRMTFDLRSYGDNDKLILQKLITASEYIDTIYWMQTSKAGFRMVDSLSRLSDPYSKDLTTLLERNGGPFELLDDFEPFIGNQTYYGGDEIYPRGLSANKFEAYLETLSEEEKAEFMYPYTVIRKDKNRGYLAKRYYQEYKEYIDPIVILLNEVANLSDNESFAKYLRLKAIALTTDNYYDADVAWIDMKDNKFDIVFGPYEQYSDNIMGVKAKYEANIEIIDEAASEDLRKYTSYLKQLEENLPISDEYKSINEGLTANFTVVRDIIRKGEARFGYQAVATNLPNDSEVHKTKGTKKTFWKNMFEARFNAIIKPVSNVLIDENQLKYLSDEGFFKFVLMHEICHAIGPREVKVGPKKGMAVNAAIGPNASPLEETKADIVGLYSLAYLMEQGVEDKAKAKEFYVSFLGSLFRSIRFGLEQSHGRAAAISLNYLLHNGGINYNSKTKKWSINFDNFEAVIAQLGAELMILQGNGDNEKVELFFDKWTKESELLIEAMNLVSHIAIDVMPEREIIWD